MPEGWLDIDVTRPAELRPAEIEKWRDLQRAEPALANPFLSPDFARAVGSVRDDARIAVVRRAGLSEAFLAYQRMPFGWGRPIAAGLSDHQAVVARSSSSWRPQELLRACGLHSLMLENYPVALLPRQASQLVTYPSPVIDLSGGYEKYLMDRRQASQGLVQSTNRKRRKLEREVGELRFEFDETDAEPLKILMYWKTAQYARMSEWNRFADPRTVQLVYDLHRTRKTGCTGILSVLYAGDQIAAAHFGLRSESVLCSWFPTYNPDLARYSPGILLHFLMAEAAADAGVTAFDLGRGDHGYKNALKSYDLQLARGRLFRKSVPGWMHRALTTPRHVARPMIKRHPRLESTLRWAANLRRRMAGRPSASR